MVTKKRYIVEFLPLEKNWNVLNFWLYDKVWRISSPVNTDNVRCCHTREELEKAGFGGVFTNTMFKVTEVE